MDDVLPRKPTTQEYEMAWRFIEDQALLVRHYEKFWAVYPNGGALPIPQYIASLWHLVKLELERRRVQLKQTA
jgi:hypothetical protein